MRKQLTQYVELLFAGAPQARDIQQEILQNTLERYDDLIAQGKSPEAAYSLSISGIGDINEILWAEKASFDSTPHSAPEKSDDKNNKLRRAIAIAMYIISPIPLFILGDEIGLSILCLLAAAATALLVMNGKDHKDDEPEMDYAAMNPETAMRHKTRESIHTLIWCIGLAVYLIMSFATGAWYITWVMFPLIGCVQGLVDAITDLKEAD